MSNLVIRNARIGEGQRVDVRIVRGVVAEVAPRVVSSAGGDDLDAAGGWLIPGLHDHHLHLRSLIAARASVRVGPPVVKNRAEFSAALRAAPLRDPKGWIRAVGYHESVAGDIDAAALDEVLKDRPLRVQHRSGILWVLNSLALEKLGAQRETASGIERDEHGTPTGRLWRMDRWLAERTGVLDAQDWKESLGAFSAEAAGLGVTGWTDATPGRSDADARELAEAVSAGQVSQRLHLMLGSGGGRDAITAVGSERVTAGPVKVILDDFELPDLDELVGLVRAAHRRGNGVAVHCVTRSQLVLALAALEEEGGHGGDRIEHGSVIPRELIPRLRDRGITVVTQPNFVGERGDEYLQSVDPDELPDLWRARSLVEGGVGVACGTDAPFGDPDPWSAIRSATTRRTPSGEELGLEERVDGMTAASWWWGTGEEPSCPRRIEVGGSADLVVLGEPLAQAVAGRAAAPPVAATVVAGEVVYP